MRMSNCLIGGWGKGKGYSNSRGGGGAVRGMRSMAQRDQTV
jgi:hypothetical protein